MGGHHLLFEPLDVRLEQRGETAVIVITGACDGTCHERLRARLLEAETGGARRIVVDMTALQFIDSIGLRVVLGAWNRARCAGHAISVALAATGQVRRVFELTGVNQIVPMAESQPA